VGSAAISSVAGGGICSSADLFGARGRDCSSADLFGAGGRDCSSVDLFGRRWTRLLVGRPVRAPVNAIARRSTCSSAMAGIRCRGG